MCVLYTHTQWSLLSLRKDWNDVIFSYTDGPRDYHTTRSHRKGKYKYHYDITYMWNLNYDRNGLLYKPETDAQPSRPDLWLQRQRGGGGGSTGVSGISRCKLFYVEWINKVLLCSTRSYIHYPVTNHNEKEKEIISPGFFRKRTGVPLVGTQVFPSCSSAHSGSHFWCLARPVNTKPLLTVTIAEPLCTVLQPARPGLPPKSGEVASDQSPRRHCLPALPSPEPGAHSWPLFFPCQNELLPHQPMPERSISWNTPGLTLRHIFTSFTHLSSLVFFQRLLIFRWGVFWKSTVRSGQTYCTPISLWHSPFWSPLSPLGSRESDMHWIDETCNYFALKKRWNFFSLRTTHSSRGKGRETTNIYKHQMRKKGGPERCPACPS